RPRAELAGGGDGDRERERVAVVPLRDHAGAAAALAAAARVHDADHPHHLVVVGSQRRRAAPPEAAGEHLERGGALPDARREVGPHGGDLARAEEEGAVRHVVERDDGALGVRHLVVLPVRERRPRRAPRLEHLPPPHRRHRRRRRRAAARHLRHRAEELHEPLRVRHRVVQPHGEDEPAARQPRHLKQQQRRAEHLRRAGDVEHELLQARERRLQRAAEVLEPHVGVGLDEQHALAGAVDGELPPLELPEPPGERVVAHERPGDGGADDRRRVAPTHGGAAPVELDHRDVEPQPVLVVDVRELLQLPRRRPRRRHQLRRLPPHRELQRRR
ncbi:Os10g0503250, partial [Oryza sativa Japonica Group]